MTATRIPVAANIHNSTTGEIGIDREKREKQGMLNCPIFMEGGIRTGQKKAAML